MKIRLLLAVMILLALPMWFSTGENTNSAPFVTVAVAGHNTAGNYCECGAPGCLCDPGEEQTYHFRTPEENASEKGKPTSGPASEVDFGTTAFLLGLALFMWSRFRG